ncbi:jg13054 [Pararge aegeria aegeria]|uniref:Jg13054 protein n=1 Tax=Pararge aegeria aegeria TaxID=348720 RepID=A0A8S4S7T6_9NEOP|nr:jg13054 [Pararge aegeria aegeria]
MDINEGTTTEDLWTPYRELAAVVESYLTNESSGAPYAVHTFESVLRRHKQTFLSLLKNPAKNPVSREEIKRGITEGVNLPSVGRTVLSKELVDEAIIISDMYNANEFACLELLHTAQRQSARRPGLARGLLAVFLYYDGRRALVQALRELIMARDGVSWSINAREEVVSYVSRYVGQLVSDGLLAGVLDALRRFDLDTELDLLRRNRALPPRKYHVKLVSTIQSTRKLLAGVVFAASAQRGLERDTLLRLLSEQMIAPSKGPTGALDEISLALQMALLYALDLSVLHRREDGEELAKKLPLIQDPDLISVLLDQLSPPPQPIQGQEDNKNSAGLKALCQLSLGLALAALKRAPVSLLRRTEPKTELLDQDEMLVDAAIDGGVFEYLDEAILSTDLVASEEYYQRRVHSLITDFIVLMHSKLMEMRVKAEEAARSAQMYMAEGLNAPGGVARSRLEALLRCVERLYARDPLQLRRDYWVACDTTAHNYRAGGRAATLYKFVRLSGEVVVAALLPAYLRALAALAVPKHTWALLARRDALSAHHLLTALSLYHRNLRADPAPFSDHLHSSSLGASAIVTPAARPGRLLVRQEEVEAMIAALKLIAAVAHEDDAACVSICENLQWDAVNCMFGECKIYVQQTLISSLKILERALALERPLNVAAAEAGRGALVVGLSKLILAPEGPDDTDRLITCCKVLEHGAVLPEAAAKAVALLCRALQSPSCARHLLASVLHRHELSVEIRHGFVECLEAEEWAAGEVSPGGAEHARAAKEGVVLLLLQLLPTAPHSLAHFLLGYNLNDDISKSVLHEAGSAGAPRTCFHSVLDILESFIAPSGSTQKEATTLVESCYRLLYGICARPATSPPALRFLRARDYFLPRHVKATVNLETATPATISSRSWALRACACEAGAAGAGRHHAALQALLTALTHSPQRNAQAWEWCVIRRSLESLPVTVEAVPEPRWELFHAHQLRQAIADCDLPTGLGGKRISVSRVNALLSRELASLRASTQRELVVIEIQKVLDYVTEVNKQRNLAATLSHYYDSWRQLTEILFCVAPQDLLNVESRKSLILNILQDLLNKIPPAEVLPQVGNLASGTVLLLLVNLRHCYILQKRESSLKSAEFETSFFGPSNQIMQTKSLTLKFILHKILSWILVSGVSTQKIRVNLYGALLNFLNIVNLKQSPADPEEDGNTTYVSRLDSSKTRPSREESNLKSMAIDVINSFGDNLCSIVCSDCIGGGHDVCRMVALSCLDTLVEINPSTDWMNTLTNQGNLRSLIDSLLQDDEGLKEALEPKPKSLRVLYVYESKMALLIKIAGTRLGAETILAQGALSCLANMRVLDCHPDIHTGYGQHQDTEFVPSVANRFRDVLVPALALCDALLTTLGADNHSCVLHITHLLLSHLECVDMVLRAAHPSSPAGLLLELEALSSVVARSSHRDVFCSAADTALQHSAAGMQRIQYLMLALLPRFQQPPPETPDHDARIYYKSIDSQICLIFKQNTEFFAIKSCYNRSQLYKYKLNIPAQIPALYAITRPAAIRGAAGDEPTELRKELLSVFNERFVDELLDTAKNQPPIQRGFLEVLLKDIKTMIQFSPL